MKSLRYYTILLLLSLIIACNKDDDSDKFEIDNDVEYYKDYQPDLIIQKNDTVLIDVDNDGSMDVIFMFNGYGINCLNDDFSVSIGEHAFSGSYVEVIKFNEIIVKLQDWWPAQPIQHYQNVEYVGFKRITKNISYFGWIKISVGYESITIEEFYFRKEPDTIVKAGIKEY
ncbi:MAG: hypothetical protein GQ525_06860 [Draconibacterium sp.]|nr:hypothetical protein [Draconibacterium sp.]